MFDFQSSAHDAAGRRPAPGPRSGPALRAEVAYRGLAQNPEVGMQGGNDRAPDRRAHRAGRGDQRGDRLADRDPHAPGADAAGTAGDDRVHRHRAGAADGLLRRPEAAAARGSRAGVPPRGDDGRLPEPQQRRTARRGDRMERTDRAVVHRMDARPQHQCRGRQRSAEANQLARQYLWVMGSPRLGPPHVFGVPVQELSMYQT